MARMNDATKLALLIKAAREASGAIDAMSDAFEAGDIREPYNAVGELACDRLWAAVDSLQAVLKAVATN